MKRIITLFISIIVVISCNSKREEKLPEGEISVEEAIVVVEGIDVTYTADSVEMKGYLAYNPNNDENLPGILVVHEWWGHNEHARTSADRLASLGYIAMAVDMYGDGKTAQHPSDAGSFAGMVSSNMEGARERFLAALDVLKSQEHVDPDRIGAIGYCFGGGIVLNMARMGLDLDGVVSFHGTLSTKTPAGPGAIKAKILVCHGADDSFISEEQLAAFKQEMSNAGADMTFISYEEAVHSFTNPEADKIKEEFGIGVGYNQKAEMKSWNDMKLFFEEVFADK